METQYGIQSDWEDSDQDGRPAKLEYFAGTRPDTPDFVPFLRILQTTPESMRFSFEESRSHEGVTGQLEWSHDLIEWNDANTTPQSSTTSDKLLERIGELPQAEAKPLFLACACPKACLQTNGTSICSPFFLSLVAFGLT